MSAVRQQVLILYLSSSALDAPVIGWARHDGADRDDRDRNDQGRDDEDRAAEPGDGDEPPYARGIDALRDGWRLIQASPLVAHVPGSEFTTSYLKYEFFFEKLVDRESGRETMA